MYVILLELALKVQQPLISYSVSESNEVCQSGVIHTNFCDNQNFFKTNVVKTVKEVTIQLAGMIFSVVTMFLKHGIYLHLPLLH